jgi:hypothetical protein
LQALQQPDATIIGVHPDDPTIEIQALNVDVFGRFSDAELAFFKIRDALSTDTLPTPDEVRLGTKTNLARQTVPIALSVLVKSVVALLIDRFRLSPSGPRTIWAVPCTPEGNFAETLRADGFKPFHEDVFWKVNVEADVIEVQYYAHGVIVFFWFLPQSSLRLQQQLVAALPQFDHWLFEGASLRQMQATPWRSVHKGGSGAARNARCGCGSGSRFKHCHGAMLFALPR